MNTRSDKPSGRGPVIPNRRAQLRTLEESAAAVNPRPPQPELGTLREMATATASGAR